MRGVPGWVWVAGGTAVAIIAIAVAVTTLNGDDDDRAGGDDGFPTVLEPAPIESVALNIAESFPPQYFLVVVSGLQNGCVQFEGYGVERDGNDVVVTVTNRVPAPGSGVVCTQVYSTRETNIALGSDFTSGETYGVVVNEKQWAEFVAQ